MSKVTTYQLETLTCPSCIAKIEGMLKKSEGVEQAAVLFNSSKVRVTLNEDKVDAEAIRRKISGLGYDVLAVK